MIISDLLITIKGYILVLLYKYCYVLNDFLNFCETVKLVWREYVILIYT